LGIGLVVSTISQGQVGHTFSSKMKQARSAAQCSGDRGLKTPPNIISVNINSSPVEISHATRPFISTTSSAVVNPSRRRTLFLDLSSSRWRISCTEFNFRFRALTLSIAVCLRSNRSYSAGSDGELERGRVWILFSSSAICYHQPLFTG
jgi:hypothetical protein